MLKHDFQINIFTSVHIESSYKYRKMIFDPLFGAFNHKQIKVIPGNKSIK